MNYWLFQSIAERYDLREDNVIVPGKTDTWYATRYKDRMKIGDKVYFWLGGIAEERGIYGVGMISSNTYRKEEWNADGIDVVYTEKLSKPITVLTFKNNSILSNLLILRAPQATNFSLSSIEATEIEYLVGEPNHG
jgi:predicted RNA-binding protein with PUA-like domain